MIKRLSDKELEAVSGGFVGGSLHELLVGEIGPIRLTSNPSNTDASIQIEDEIIQRFQAAQTLDEEEFHESLLSYPENKDRFVAQIGSALYRQSRRGSSETLTYRDSDRAMARQARCPATLSWKTNYLVPR